MKKYINIIKKRCTIDDIFKIIIFPFIFLINLFVRKKLKKKKIWLISENKNEACDNGYVLFTYLRNNKFYINAFYVIDIKSPQYDNVKDYGNIINFGSLKHWLYYLNADKIITTQQHSNPFPLFFYFLIVKDIFKTPVIFLQHGIIMNNSKYWHYPKTHFRLFICGALAEYNYVSNNFFYPSNYVKYTGLARFDNLNNSNSISNVILIYPTWRKYNDLTNYIKRYNDILNDDKFNDYVLSQNIKVYFILHKNFISNETKC